MSFRLNSIFIMDPRRARTSIFTLLIIFLLFPRIHGAASRLIKIGAIFHKEDSDYEEAFMKAISDVATEYEAPAFKLESSIKKVEVNTDSFKTGAAVCELLDEGVAAIFGPASSHTRGIVSSIAARFDVPHIEYVWRHHDIHSYPTPMTINFYPSNDMITQAIADVVNELGWQSYAIIYETEEGLARVQRALSIPRPKKSPITIRQIGEGPDYRPVLKEISNMSIFNVIIDVNPKNIISVLYQAKEVKLLRDYCNFFVTYLDSSYLPFYDVQNGTTANITIFAMRSNEQIKGLNWIDMAVLYDAVFAMDKALEVLEVRNKDDDNSLQIDPVALSCEGSEKYAAGPNITSLIREIIREGKVTGPIIINEDGQRQHFHLKIVNVRSTNNTVFANWDPSKEDRIQKEQSRHDEEKYWSKSMEQKVFKVITREENPYVMEVTDENLSKKNGSSKEKDVIVTINQKRYEGYCIDLIDMIAKELNFKYEFELVRGNSYGTYIAETNTWTGLIKQLIDHEADLAICDLTITYLRESAVDFTMPFMNLGISILFSKPEDKQPDLFSFLSPFSTEVWMYMATAYLAVSLMLFLQARVAPGEWDNPHPCNPDPEELENNFNLKNSLWLTVGSLMQQGSDILPKAPSIRMVAGMWWFFTLIMVSSYTANLAAFLTVDKMDNPIKNVEDLAKQTKIKYGAIKDGATSSFFRDSNYSTYKRMWAAMADARPSVFTENNNEGVERVVKSKRSYAFLMESTTIDYKMERNCDIEKVGDLIDNKGYGIALPRNSPYRTLINGVILKLQEKGVLSELKDKWWIHRGGGKCKKIDTEPSGSELGLANVGGVFLVLMCGCAASFIIAICEFLWNVRKVAVEEKITPGEALMAELKFAINIWAETKPVKIAKSTSGSSSTAGGLDRAASTARSIVGSFLRLDILDKYDKDNNTNKRNNDRKIN